MFKILIFLFFTIEVFAYINITPITFDERIDRDGGVKNTLFQILVKRTKDIEYM